MLKTIIVRCVCAGRLWPTLVDCGHSGDGGERGEDALVEAVAEAADATDEDGGGGIGFDLLTQAKDVDVDRAVGYGAVVAPDRVEQLFPAENYTGARHQKFKETEFGGGELKVGIVELDAAGSAIQFEVASLEDLGGRLVCAEVNLYAGDEFADKERLNDVVVCAEFEAEDSICFTGAGSEENNGDADQFWMAADSFADVEAIGIGKHDVEQDQVRLFAAAEVNGTPAGLGTHQSESFFLQVVLEEGEQVGVIFDQNDFLHVVPM